MNQQRDDDLNRLLRDWAAVQRPEQVRLEALRERIIEAADRPGGRGAEASAVGRHDLKAADGRKTVFRAVWRRRLGWFALGAAAAILAAVCMLSTRGPGRARDGQRLHSAGLPPDVQLDRQQLAAQARLFAAMEEVFAGGLNWMAESDGKVSLGVAPEMPGPPDGSRPVSVRLVVMARRPGEAAWHRRMSVDCILRSDQLVELAPPHAAEARVALWTHLLPDGMIAVDTSLGMDETRREASSSAVQPAQVPRRILDLRTNRDELQVFQTVAVLPKEVG